MNKLWRNQSERDPQQTRRNWRGRWHIGGDRGQYQHQVHYQQQCQPQQKQGYWFQRGPSWQVGAAQKVNNNSAGNTKAYVSQCEFILTPSLSINMYQCLEDDNEKTIVTDNWSWDDNMAPTSGIIDDSSIDSDEENMKIYPSNLWTQTVFNTSNINIAVDMAITYAEATGHFSCQVPLSRTLSKQRNICSLAYQMERK